MQFFLNSTVREWYSFVKNTLILAGTVLMFEGVGAAVYALIIKSDPRSDLRVVADLFSGKPELSLSDHSKYVYIT